MRGPVGRTMKPHTSKDLHLDSTKNTWVFSRQKKNLFLIGFFWPRSEHHLVSPRPSSASIFALAASELASATEEEAESKMSCATSWPAFLERNIWTPKNSPTTRFENTYLSYLSLFVTIWYIHVRVQPPWLDSDDDHCYKLQWLLLQYYYDYCYHDFLLCITIINHYCYCSCYDFESS